MDHPFLRINIDRLTEGPTKVFWDLLPQFKEPGPYRFRVQVSETGNAQADDWKDVGAETTETVFAVDNTKRDFARAILSHYRVIITTGTGRYISPPVTALQHLDLYQWRIASEKMRRTRKALLRNPETRSGYLLLRRRFGPDCTRCFSTLTGENRDADCPVCYGTSKLGGYFQPMPDQKVFITPRILLERVEPGQPTRGDDIRQGTFLGYPQLRTYDVFVDDKTDERFVLHTVKITEAVAAVPIAQAVEMAVLDFNNVIYKFPLGIS